MRLNPYWFNKTGDPTEYLENMHEELKRALSNFSFENYSVFVVGSNARGNWRSVYDIEKILEITEKARNSKIDSNDIEFLSRFYSFQEIKDYFFNPSHKYYLNPGRLYVSDLDFKIKGIKKKVIYLFLLNIKKMIFGME